jgi:DNA polymerase/3'-5' exonuclease PolX
LAYRKAAWAIEDLEQDVGLVYHTLGAKGLQSIPDIGQSLAGVMGKLIEDCSEVGK